MNEKKGSLFVLKGEVFLCDTVKEINGKEIVFYRRKNGLNCIAGMRDCDFDAPKNDTSLGVAIGSAVG